MHCMEGTRFWAGMGRETTARVAIKVLCVVRQEHKRAEPSVSDIPTRMLPPSFEIPLWSELPDSIYIMLENEIFYNVWNMRNSHFQNRI